MTPKLHRIITITSPGAPILRRQAKIVQAVTEDIRQLMIDLFYTMRVNNGVGLAAPQIGIQKAVCVIYDSANEHSYGLVNPVIEKAEGSIMMQEGCLSIPGVQIKVKRAEEIWVKALNLQGQKVKFNIKGLGAYIIQHEVDHLAGRLIIDQ